MSTALVERDHIDGELEIAERLPADMMLLKMENDQIFSVARMHPRKPAEIIRQLKELIDAYPAAADEAIYCKPVGTVQEVTCGKCKLKYEVNKIDAETCCPDCKTRFDTRSGGSARSVKKFAEGLSIRAAESIRTIFGYTRMATKSVMAPDGTATLTGTLVDYAAGNITTDERTVTPHYKTREGHMARVPEDRFVNVVVKAEKSKLRRDVILDSTPGIVKQAFRDICEKKLEELVTPEVIQQKIIPQFTQYGISAEQLDKIIGKPAKLGWSMAERLQCRKIIAGLKSGETTVGELLGQPEESPASGKKQPKASPLNEPAEPPKGDAYEGPANEQKTLVGE